MSNRQGAFWAMMAGLVLVSGCQMPPESAVIEQEESGEIDLAEQEESPADSVERTPPPWQIMPSLSEVEECKVLDGQPAALREMREGYSGVGGVRARGNVGFPLSPTSLPVKDEANLIVAMVSFDDAPPSELTPEGFLAPQLQKMTQWSEFFPKALFATPFKWSTSGSTSRSTTGTIRSDPVKTNRPPERTPMSCLD